MPVRKLGPDLCNQGILVLTKLSVSPSVRPSTLYVSQREMSHLLSRSPRHIQLFRERLSEKNVHMTIPKGNMGYDQYTVPDDCSCRTYFCCFHVALADTFPWPFVPILSNFFEKKRNQNYPQCLSGLSRALFPTTILEIAVYNLLT